MRLPCDERCVKLLSCGHRCPSVCGEVCPSASYCVEKNCGQAQKGSERVSFVDLDLTLAENPCDTNPVIVLKCGHVFAVSELDSWLDLDSVYLRDADGGWAACKPLNCVSMDPKACPHCKAPIRGVFRYGRVLAKLFLDAVNKKYLPWSEERVAELELKLDKAKNVAEAIKLQKKADALCKAMVEDDPTARVIAGALSFLDGNTEAAATLGIPANHVWPRLRSVLLLAKVSFKLSLLHTPLGPAAIRWVVFFLYAFF
jgi:hypothetical protein